MADMPFGIEQVIDLLGIVRKNNGMNSKSFSCQCPLCGDSGYHMNVRPKEAMWRCPKCGEGGGVLQLYAAVKMGVPTESYNKDVGKAAYRELSEIFGNGKPLSVISPLKTELQTNTVADVIVQQDSSLNAAYTHLLNYPCFELTESHRDSLKKRGLSDEAIERNGYRSMNMSAAFKTSEKFAIKASKLAQEARATIPECKFLTQEEALRGIAIAKAMQRDGFELKGIPGFYTIGKQWMFRIYSGIVIPTRNITGEIVSLQVRKDGNAKGPRYMSVSSKDMPNGVSSGTRLHFPLRSEEGIVRQRVAITEGPLKADIAAFLSDYKITFFAVQGVNSTSELPKTVSKFKDLGVLSIINALDMDKLVNKNVRKGSVGIRQIITRGGLKVINQCWDAKGAEKKAAYLEDICSENNISVQKREINENIFSYVINLAMMLESTNIQFDTDWIKETKGIDDYLLLSLNHIR